MIQFLSGRFQKQSALLILLVLVSETVMAGREHLLRRKGNKSHEYSSYSHFPSIPVPQPVLMKDAAITLHSEENGLARPVPESKDIAAQLLKMETRAITNRQPVATAARELGKPDIGGPGQPEMSAFKSVGADNMVDLFSGDFSYNIPLGDVGGYPINIFYNSGITMDQEASWVGLGWNINPGTIMRNMRGVPDDFDGLEDKIRKEMNIKPNITVGVSGRLTRELTGFPTKNPNGTDTIPGARFGSLTMSAGIFYNNYRGLGLELGTNTTLNIKRKNGDSKTSTANEQAKDTTTTSVASASLGFNINSQTGVNINPGLSLHIEEKTKKILYGTSTSLSAQFNSRVGLQNISLSAESNKSEIVGEGKNTDIDNKGTYYSATNALTFGVTSITPSIRMPLTHRNYNLGFSLGKEFKPTQYTSKGLSGYYSEATLRDKDKVQEKPAFGYLYYQNADNNQEAMLDFNRLTDVVYTKNNPVIAVPYYTHDVFSISGQGIGGGFRAYRGDIGSVHDHYTRTRENASSIDLEFGSKDKLELGINLNYVHTPTWAGEWRQANLAREDLKFYTNKKLHAAAYFKNPGEAARIDPEFINNIGNEDRIKIKLADPSGTKEPVAQPVWEKFADGSITPTEISFAGGNKTIKQQRDRRTQVISYLTAEEAAAVGLERKIHYYPYNTFPTGGCNNAGAIKIDRIDPSVTPGSNRKKIRKANHLSEITVTQTDGKRYVYGLPVYNLREEEVSFNVGPKIRADGAGANNTNLPNQTVDYSPADDLMKNERGKDHFYQKDEVDPYAHSFLLTGLLSPDYVDVTSDGITDDDLGTAVKFNYTRIEHPDQLKGIGFGWRAPFTSTEGVASYNQGLKTDKSDDKGHYTYGERELWYLNSIESKTMIATFTLENRNDGKAAAGPAGGVSTSLGMKRLKQIDIYSKAEWVKTEGVKRPVKTIHFEYYDGTNELCNGTPNNPTGGGKLTLKSIYFTYNGNNRQFKNKYFFKYHSNPNYDRMANDRWGNYKPSSANGSTIPAMNFSALDNSDFPFADQDKATADMNAAAWTLNEITLPSGAKIKVDFESDDYAYVQNRRAAQPFRIAGFGSSSGSAPTNQLYDFVEKDKLYVFVDVPVPVASKAEIKNRYLDGINQLLMKLWVDMPKDQYGSGFEPVTLYAFVNNDATDNYGLVNANRIWIKVQKDKGNHSPMFYNAMKFLTQNLTSKAYPGSDVKGKGLVALLKALGGMLFSTLTAAGNYIPTLRFAGACKKVDLQRSFIRLNNPFFRKQGGGLRVKKVTIKDSWKQMTATNPAGDNGMPESEYGQEYDYTTTELVNGLPQQISSGVASYEPMIGAEENPFREILYYDDHQPLGPNQRGAIEVPIGEVFFPSASVGYSKVTVRSIHRDNVKSGVGKTVSEFYTSRDFPTKSDFTNLDPSANVRKSDAIMRMLKWKVKEMVTISQGFRVQTNDMNGKLHRQSSYDEGGKLVTSSENIFRITKSGENEYTFNNVVPMLTEPGAPVINGVMGKEIEVMTDFREHNTRAVTFNLNINLNVNVWNGFPVPVPSIVPPVHFAETGYRSAAVMKVVHTFGILEKVKHIDKGSEVSTKDLAYDAETGNVLVTETNNEFNKPVYSFNYPAYWAYKGMQGAWKNIDAVFEHVRFQNGKLTSPGSDFSMLESGDELYVKDLSTKGAANEPGCYPTGPVQFIPKPRDPDNPDMYVRKIWALDMAKDPANTESRFLFIDKNGEPYSGGDVTVKIIRSGKRNLLDASVGGFTSMSNPIRETAPGSGVYQLKADDETKLVNTTANTFNEKWRVDKAFYTENVYSTVIRKAPVHKIALSPAASAAFAERNSGENKQLFANPPYVTASQYDARGGHEDYRRRSWLLFDFLSAPGLNRNSIVRDAKLFLPSHKANHTETVSGIGVSSSHNMESPHYSANTHLNHLIIQRMRSNWPSLTDFNAWQTLYDNDLPGGTPHAVFIPATPPVQSAADYNVFGYAFTAMVAEMVKDKFDPTKNFASGIKIKLYDDIGHYFPVARVCFDNTPESHPVLNMEYYNCDQNNPIVYQGPRENAPVFPPDPNFEYCATEEWVTFCKDVFSKKRMNPYCQGVLGNWRADVAFAYFDNRREDKADQPTAELSKGGVIATGYVPFWLHTANGLALNSNAFISTAAAPAKWKWASKVTQFNNKGFEMENTDPLGRYNAGIYGYDKSLPVAVVNNSKLRNAAFDGFEDYTFKSNNCVELCKQPRHLTIENAAGFISKAQSHTGLSSLKVPAGQSVSIKAPIVSKLNDEKGFDIKISTVTTSMTGTWVDGRGTGITGKYFNKTSSQNYTPANIEGWLNNEFEYPQVRADAGVNMESWSNTGNPPNGIGPDRFYVKWQGYIQAPITGVYQLAFTSDDGMKVWIDGYQSVNQVTPNNFFRDHLPYTEYYTTGTWTIGSIHSIQIYYYENQGDATAKLSWTMPGMGEEPIPKMYLYVQPSDAANTIISGTYNCVKPDEIKVVDNAMTDVFSPLQKQKMVFSAWVKEGLTDCHCGNYTGNEAKVYFDNNTTATVTLTPSGKIIEGWQRYEGVFDVPDNATSMEIKLLATGLKDTYWDDIRIHPFNSNMKSFVYDPVTLRLVADQDENNYSSFYEYDDDGTLIRVKKETERGVKTISETRSSLQKKITQ
ncbi:MAG: PA14 domain-containing protein [Bacteroidetes bacterium]|nr:PA14 domain-containing protein [Bacteroidota bacterium]